MAEDWSLLTDWKYALSWGLKKAPPIDAYQKKEIFKAIALTNSFALTDAEAAAIDKSVSDVDLDKVPSRFVRRYFIGRVIDPNSPHSFLPDPCDFVISDDPACVARVIGLHTIFVLTEQMANASMGEFFDVLLSPGTENAPYNLQFGVALNKTGNSTSRRVKQDLYTCETLSELMENGESHELGDHRSHTLTRDDNLCGQSGILNHPFGENFMDVTSGAGFRGGSEGTGGEARAHQGNDIGGAGQLGDNLYAPCNGIISAKGGPESGAYVRCGIPLDDGGWEINPDTGRRRDVSVPGETKCPAASPEGQAVRGWGGTGNFVFIKCDAATGVGTTGDGIKYFHMQSPTDLDIDDRIVAGETVVGQVGNTGNNTVIESGFAAATLTPHLHMEIRDENGNIIVDVEDVIKCGLSSGDWGGDPEGGDTGIVVDAQPGSDGSDTSAEFE